MPETTTPSGSQSRWARIRRGISEVLNAQAAVWDTLARMDPDPNPYLHWESTMSGWRLYGHLLPPE